MTGPAPHPRATSVTHEVAATLRALMARGELRPGMRLPSERALSARLAVSRSTVVRALDALRQEGLVHTRHGSGTYVATSDRLIDTVAARQDRPAPAAVAGPDALDLRWATTAGPADLTEVVRAAVHDTLPLALRGDGSTSGSLSGLVEQLADHLTRSGLPTRPGQLILTSGAMTGLGLVLDVAGPSGGRAAVTETPTYPGALRILAQRGRRARGWPAGPAGWDPAHLARLLRASAPGVLYLQPDGHNPTGASMPAAARDAAARAAAAGWLVVADETMRPLNPARDGAGDTAGDLAPSLATVDNRVIVVSSLSKTVWGGLRLGWIRAPAALTRQLRGAAVATGAGPGALDQITAARLLPSLDQVVQRRTRLLGENLQHLEHRLRGLAAAGASLRWHRPAGGITLWLDLHPRSSYGVVRDCARLGVLLEPASTYATDGRDDRHLRIPFTLPPPALDRVADVLRDVLVMSHHDARMGA
jgi:DNA-binding transcriptional MocR family regulator